jgi:ADP-heptose:LPS heptosyltransferase
MFSFLDQNLYQLKQLIFLYHLIYQPNEFEHIELPEKYVCISTEIRRIDRTWTKEKWQNLVDKLNDKGI